VSLWKTRFRVFEQERKMFFFVFEACICLHLLKFTV
jgi:hypothetical protein